MPSRKPRGLRGSGRGAAPAKATRTRRSTRPGSDVSSRGWAVVGDDAVTGTTASWRRCLVDGSNHRTNCRARWWPTPGLRVAPRLTAQLKPSHDNLADPGRGPGPGSDWPGKARFERADDAPSQDSRLRCRTRGCHALTFASLFSIEASHTRCRARKLLAPSSGSPTIRSEAGSDPPYAVGLQLRYENTLIDEQSLVDRNPHHR